MGSRTFHLFSILTLLTSPLLALKQQEKGAEDLAPNYEQYKARALSATVDYFESLFLTQYAPLRWKQRQWSWNPQAEARTAKERLKGLKSFEIDKVKPIFNRLLASCRDGHVGVTYHDTGGMRLPFDVEWIDGRVIVTSSSLSKIQPGDEILKVGNQKVLDYVSQALYGTTAQKAPLSRPYYDLERAFRRVGFRDPLPKLGTTLQLELKRNGSPIVATASWQAIKVVRSCCFDESNSLKLERNLPEPLQTHALERHLWDDAFNARQAWLNSQESSWALNPSFYEAHSYLRDEGGFKIGYFRLPDFMDQKSLELFEAALARFNNEAQAVVIDLRDNPGGSVLLCYAFLCRLTDQPLANLIESSLIDQKSALSARHLAELLRGLLAIYTSDHDLQIALDCDQIAGYPLTCQLLQDWLLDALATVEEWESGSTCTRFTPMMGMAQIMPHPKIRYTGPLYVMIDQRSGSCGDLFPAILKDSGRATIVGRTTAGLGGSVQHFTIPNFTGIESFSLTRSFGLRNNQRVIEDLGIEPHHAYSYTVEDALNPKLELERTFGWVAKQCQGETTEPSTP